MALFARFAFFLFLSLSPLLRAQTCPPVSFLNINQLSLGSGTSTPGGTALIRQPDGTYSGFRGLGRPPGYSFQSITPNFQNNLYNCSPLAGRPHAGIPGRPNFLDTLPGTGGRNPLAVDYLGDSTSLSGFVVDYLSTLANGVSYAIANTNGSLRTNGTAASGSSPERMVTADFNGDGRRDLAILNRGPFNGTGSISVFLNNGTTTLPTPTTYATNNTPTAITTADFNSDNRPDLAILDTRLGSSGDRYVALYLNNGNGTFGTPSTFLSPGFGLDLIAADATGDGIPDLITAGSSITVYPGTGNGTFRAPLLTPLTTSPFYIAAGDFNKDGRIDIVGSEVVDRSVAIYLNSGAGLFSGPRRYSLGLSSGVSEPYLFVTDFDGDTWPDIVLGGGHPDALTPPARGSSVRVLINRADGSGAFFGAPLFPVSANPSIADFNGDGRPDMLSSSNNGLAFHAGTGSGFQEPIAAPVLTHQNFATRLLSSTPGDFNNDGRVDAAVYNGAFSILLSNGNGSFTQSATRIASPTDLDVNTLAAGDLNGDNQLDLVASQTKSFAPFPTNVLIFRGTGDGGLQNPTTLATCANPTQVLLADVNADGKLDLIATCTGYEFSTPATPGGVAVAFGAGNGTFAPPAVYLNDSNPDHTTVADLNADNRPDLVVSTNQPSQLGVSRVAILYNSGNGAFQAPVYLATDFGPNGHAISDFTGDGRPDILTGHCCGETDIGIYVNNGNGTFGTEVLLPLGEATSLQTADVNADGKLDVLALQSGGSMKVLFNGTVAPPAEACSFTLSRSILTAASGGEALGVFLRPSSPACTWSAATSDAWLTVSNAQRTGGGALLITVAANPTNAYRTGSVIIAGLPVAVTQYPTIAGGCTYTINPSSFSFSGDFASAEYAVQTGNNCPWSTFITSSWVFSNNTWTGPRGFLSMSASSNGSGSPRAAVLNIGGTRAQILQRAFLESQPFTDVPTSDSFFPYIGLIRNRAITLGCTATTYCPGAAINRGQMAVFLVRTILGTETFNFPATPFFTDVPADHPFFRYIQKLRELNITAGCTATTYCPNDSVTRGQMAAFLIRGALGVAPGGAFPFPTTGFFTDVPSSHPFFSFIQLMRNRGITSGCTATTYCPDAPVTRGQMAVFLVRGLIAE
ncbi:MAG: VCBS repeat-containing protein [Bryobacterales bacterium]|nr:VCBS repeat-containing protein [Bryobacterales bacterium]